MLDNEIDVVVDPIFKIEKRGFSGYRVTVHGFAGFYKTGKSGLDQVIDGQYKKEDIEKYLLLTDPSFMKYYYNHGSCDGHVYNIKCAPCNEKKTSITQINTKVDKKKKEKKPKKDGKGKLAAFFSGEL